MRRFVLLSFFFLLGSNLSLAQERTHDIQPEDYFDIATLTSCQLSPHCKYIAYTESRWGRGNEGRKKDLWSYDRVAKIPRRLTFDGFSVGHLAWGPDQNWIYFAGRGPNKTTQLWKVSSEGGSLTQLTRLKKGIQSFVMTEDAKTIYYTTSEKHVADEWKELRTRFPDLEYGHGITFFNPIWKLDLVTWRTEQVLKADRVIHEFALSPDRKKIAMITTDDNEIIFNEGFSRVEILDLETKKIQAITDQKWRKDHPSPFGWIENIAWSSDSKALAFSISFDGYPTLLYAGEFSQNGVQVSEVKRPGFVSVMGGLKWFPNSRTLCFKGEEKARVRVVSIHDVKDGKQGKVEILTPGDLVIQDFCFCISGECMAVIRESTSHMGDLFFFKFEDDDFTRVTNVNPQVDTWKLPQISIFSYQGADEDMVDAILELPPAYKKEDGPLPLLVELHGGPTASTLHRLRFWIYGRALAPAKGYALFSPNYHGSTGYGDEFMTKLVGRENDIEVIDIYKGIQALIKEGIADPDRIGVMGWSNGGFLTNAMITKHPDLFKAASSGAGVLDQTLQWSTEDTPGHVVNFMEGLPWEKTEAYIKGSPMYLLHQVKTPTLIHVGGDDPRVPPEHSRALYRALYHYLRVPVELVVYPNEGHGLSTHTNRLAKMKWDLAWFDKYLLGK